MVELLTNVRVWVQRLSFPTARQGWEDRVICSVVTVTPDAILVPHEGVSLVNLQPSEAHPGELVLLVGIIRDIFSSLEISSKNKMFSRNPRPLYRKYYGNWIKKIFFKVRSLWGLKNHLENCFFRTLCLWDVSGHPTKKLSVIDQAWKRPRWQG